MAIDNDTLKIVVPAISTAIASIVANIVQYQIFKRSKAAEREVKIVESYNDFYIRLLNELSVIINEHKALKKSGKRINSYKRFGLFLCNSSKGTATDDACKQKCSKAFSNIVQLFKDEKYYPLNNKINAKIFNLMLYIQCRENCIESTTEIRLPNLKKLHNAISRQLKKIG